MRTHIMQAFLCATVAVAGWLPAVTLGVTAAHASQTDRLSSSGRTPASSAPTVIAVLTSYGTVVAKEGGLSAGWVTEYNGASQVAAAG